MTAEFKLTEDDYLTHNLYRLSQSEWFKKGRRRGMVPMLFAFLLATTLTMKTEPVWAAIFVCCGIAWYFLFPRFIKGNQASQMRLGVREQYGRVMQNTFHIELSEGVTLTKLGATESRTPLTDILKIEELPTIVIVSYKSGLVSIFPKFQNAGTDGLIAALKEKAGSLGVKYRHEPDWKWG